MYHIDHSTLAWAGLAIVKRSYQVHSRELEIFTLIGVKRKRSIPSIMVGPDYNGLDSKKKRVHITYNKIEIQNKNITKLAI